MSFFEIESLLQRTIGLDAASVSTATIERAVRERMSANGVSDLDVYRGLIVSSTIELQNLIEAVIVPETWFFRDAEAFGFLGRAVMEKKELSREGGMRILSLPCSSGEEPYSIGMTLFDAGLREEAFHIDAIDVSHRVLEQAQRAIYGKNSFRGSELGFRDRYFKEEAKGWRLAERVRAQVQFAQGNLFDVNLFTGSDLYEIIFCRNVLIYFDEEARTRAVEILRRLLAPRGILFVGPSETNLFPGNGFTPVRSPQAFAFRKTEKKAPPLIQPKLISEKGTAIAPAPPPSSSRLKAALSFIGTKPVLLPTLLPKAEGKHGLEKALHLADEGRLAEAAEQCEVHLQSHGPSAHLFYLFGLVCDAAGNSRKAADLYRKALYLDPQNCEVMIHLASLLESHGEEATARVLKERVRRLTSMSDLKKQGKEHV